MPQKRLHELDQRSVTPTAASILHTQEIANYDVQMTVQDVLNLVPSSGSDPGVLSGSIDTANDGVVVSDNSNSNELRRVAWATFAAEFGFPTITESLAVDGYWNIGSLQVRWGNEISSTDSSEDFTFATPFSTACFIVLTSRRSSDGATALQAYQWDENGFSVNRDNGIDGANEAFVYLAIGH
jgi:hypothetical protein